MTGLGFRMFVSELRLPALLALGFWGLGLGAFIVKVLFARHSSVA